MFQIKILLILKEKALIVKNLNKFKDDPRRFWQTINNISKGKQVSPELRLIDGDRSPVSSELTADYVNDYYITIGEKLAAEFAIVECDLEEASRLTKVNKAQYELRN